MENHPNWFDASYISWLSYDSLNIELPDGHLFFAPIINWGKYREENGRLVMPVSVRMNQSNASFNNAINSSGDLSIPLDAHVQIMFNIPPLL